MVKECGYRCKNYAEEGWNELPMCEHSKMLNKDGQGKYIYAYRGNFPGWCPMLNKAVDKVMSNRQKS